MLHQLGGIEFVDGLKLFSMRACWKTFIVGGICGRCLCNNCSMVKICILGYSCFQMGDTYGSVAFVSLIISLVGRSSVMNKPMAAFCHDTMSQNSLMSLTLT